MYIDSIAVSLFVMLSRVMGRDLLAASLSFVGSNHKSTLCYAAALLVKRLCIFDAF